MSILDGLNKFLHPGIRRSIQCGASIRRPGVTGLVKCNNIFEIAPGAAVPDIPICPRCEVRFNRGIVETIHSRSGKTSGSFHITDGYKP